MGRKTEPPAFDGCRLRYLAHNLDGTSTTGAESSAVNPLGGAVVERPAVAHQNAPQVFSHAAGDRLTIGGVNVGHKKKTLLSELMFDRRNREGAASEWDHGVDERDGLKIAEQALYRDREGFDLPCLEEVSPLHAREQG